MRRRVQSWAQWQEFRRRELLRSGLDIDLCKRLLIAEVAARKRVAKDLGRDAARYAELVVTEGGRLALSVDAKYVDLDSGVLDLAWFFSPRRTKH